MDPRARRRRRYFTLMTIAVVLFVGAWAVVRLWSVPAAIAMCVVAMVLPPAAAIVGNRREPGERWWGEDPDADEETETDATEKGGGGT